MCELVFEIWQTWYGSTLKSQRNQELQSAVIFFKSSVSADFGYPFFLTIWPHNHLLVFKGPSWNDIPGFLMECLWRDAPQFGFDQWSALKRISVGGDWVRILPIIMFLWSACFPPDLRQIKAMQTIASRVGIAWKLYAHIWMGVGVPLWGCRGRGVGFILAGIRFDT